MHRIAIGLAAVSLSLVASTGTAQAADPFGTTGDVVVGGGGSYAHYDGDGVYGPGTTWSVAPRLDVFVSPHWFVGVTSTLSHSSSEAQLTNADGTLSSSMSTSTIATYSGALRFGTVVPISERFALRPVASLAVAEQTGSSTGTPDASIVRTTALLRLELAYALTDHVFLTTSFGQARASFGDPDSPSMYARDPNTTRGYSLAFGPLSFGIEGKL
jgi:hypothetical protein